MWVFLNNAMVSVVAHREKPDHVMVRARLKGDLGRVFPGCKVTRTPSADYLYRTTVSRVEFAQALADLAATVTYPNFKGSLAPGDRVRSQAYHETWDAMMAAQQTEAPGSGGLYGRIHAGGLR